MKKGLTVVMLLVGLLLLARGVAADSTMSTTITLTSGSTTSIIEVTSIGGGNNVFTQFINTYILYPARTKKTYDRVTTLLTTDFDSKTMTSSEITLISTVTKTRVSTTSYVGERYGIIIMKTLLMTPYVTVSGTKFFTVCLDSVKLSSKSKEKEEQLMSSKLKKEKEKRKERLMEKIFNISMFGLFTIFGYMVVLYCEYKSGKLLSKWEILLYSLMIGAVAYFAAFMI